MFRKKLFIYTSLAVLILLIFIYHSTNVKEEDEYLKLLGPDDFTSKNKIFNLDLKYLIRNEDICKNKSDIFAIILVTSYFGNIETRSAMRRAFSEETLMEMKIKRVFLLGKAPKDKYTSQNDIILENYRFKDIIQGNFDEAYKNLTYKHLMGLKWVNENCNNTKYVFKMDDDIVVNLRKILNLIKVLKFPKKLLAGYVFRNMKPIREKQNKWYVSEEEYKENYYPVFVSGWFYITNQGTIQEIIQNLQKVKYFWIDDLLITGILAKIISVKHFDMSKYFTVNPEYLDCCIRDVKNKHEDCDILVGPNGGNNNLFYTFNEAMTSCFNEKCAQRDKLINETCVAEFKLNLIGRGDASIATYKLH